MSGAGETLPVGAAAEEPTSGEGRTAPTGGAEEVMSAVAATGTEEELGASTKTNPNFDASRKSKLLKYCYRKGLTVESLFHKSLMESGDKMLTKGWPVDEFQRHYHAHLPPKRETASRDHFICQDQQLGGRQDVCSSERAKNLKTNNIEGKRPKMTSSNR